MSSEQNKTNREKLMEQRVNFIQKQIESHERALKELNDEFKKSVNKREVAIHKLRLELSSLMLHNKLTETEK